MIWLGLALAVVIGLALGLLGGGGAILTLPVLVYVLGYTTKMAVPATLVVVGVTAAIGAVNHQRHGHVSWPAALTFGPTAIAGAYLGGLAGLRVTSRLQLVIFALLMLGAALSMYLGPALWGTAPSPQPRRRSLVAIAAIGALVGFLTGLVGVGGGFMYVPALVVLGGVDMKQAVGTSLVLIVLSSAAGIASYLGRVPLPWLEVGRFTALAVVGVILGGNLVRHVSAAALRKGFALLLVAMAALLLLRPSA